MTTLVRLFVMHSLLFANSLAVLSAPPKSKERVYSLGPLKVDEFRGEVISQHSTSAHTATRTRYQFALAFNQVGQLVTAVVKSIELRVVFLPDESWYGPDAAVELLDHEQGHFDIAEINARRTALSLEKARRAGKFISASGNTKQAAQKAVLEKLNEIAQLVDQQTAEDNIEYDRTTRHGYNFSEQSEVRKIQKLTLKSLSEELEQLSPKLKSSTPPPSR